jgi:ABC-2 type transport system permease protein
LLAVAAALISHRDLGAALVAPRPGPPAASPRLTNAVGLPARLQRGALIGWAFGMLLWGVAFGSVGREVEELLTNIPELKDALNITGGVDLVDAFFGTAMLILALVAAGFTVASALRLRSEETAGRAEPLLATALSRVRWTLGSILVTVVGTVLVLGAGGFGAGLAHGIATGDIEQVPRLLLIALTYVPAALVLAGLVVALFGWAPRLSPAAWGALAACLVFGWLGGVLDLPAWLNNISPFSHIPSAPMESMAAGPLVALTAVALALTAVGVLGLRRRDLG